MPKQEREPRTAAEETEEEIRDALVRDIPEDEEEGGEAGDALTTNEAAQEEAHGETSE